MKTVWVKAHGGSNPSASATHGICSKPRKKKGKQFAFLFSLSSKTPCRVLLRRSGTERVTLRKAALFRRRAPCESLSLRHTRHLLKAEKEKRKAVCFPFFFLVKNALPCVASAFGNRTRDAPQGCAIPSQSSLRIPQPPPTRRNATHINRRRRYAVSCQFFVGFSFFPKHSAILRAQRERASFREFFTFLKILCFEPIPVYIIFGCRDKAISLSVFSVFIAFFQYVGIMRI